MLKTFSIQTLGCRVNQYESDQLATLLRLRGMVEVPTGGDLRIVNTCSVTVQAAAKSRQSARRAVKLPVLMKAHGPAVGFEQSNAPSAAARTLITGCWATSNRADASSIPGVDAVLTHHDNVAADLDRLLDLWNEPQTPPTGHQPGDNQHFRESPAEPLGDDGSINKVGASRAFLATDSKPRAGDFVRKSGDRQKPTAGPWTFTRSTFTQPKRCPIRNASPSPCLVSANRIISAPSSRSRTAAMRIAPTASSPSFARHLE